MPIIVSANKVKILLTKTNKEQELSKCCLQNASIKLMCAYTHLMLKCLHGFMKECQVDYQLTWYKIANVCCMTMV